MGPIFNARKAIGCVQTGSCEGREFGGDALSVSNDGAVPAAVYCAGEGDGEAADEGGSVYGGSGGAAVVIIREGGQV